MRAAVLFVFAVVIVAVSCRPSKDDLKQLKAEAERKRACLQDCSKVQYQPICAKEGSKAISFANECVMNNHNCEHKDGLRKDSNGECPGSKSIRLS